MTANIFRTLLYVPANRPRMLEKSRHLEHCSIIFDLEDAVPPDEKSAARQHLFEFLKEPFDKPCFVRINGVDTEYFEEDLRLVTQTQIRGLFLPKATPQHVSHVSHRIDSISQNPLGIIPLIETALAVETALPILQASTRVVSALFGAEDLTADLGIQRTAAGEELSYARHRVVYSCGALGLPAIDTPFLDFQNPVALEQDCLTAKKIGFAGKTCIHPNQVSVTNRCFSPTGAEIEEAREILEAAVRATGGAFSLNGKMIDGPVVDRARRILDEG